MIRLNTDLDISSISPFNFTESKKCEIWALSGSGFERRNTSEINKKQTCPLIVGLTFQPNLWYSSVRTPLITVPSENDKRKFNLFSRQ